MSINVLFDDLRQHIRLSHVDQSLDLLHKIWILQPDATIVLEELESLSLTAFSHQFPSLHVPKEHEYLLRILPNINSDLHLDFLDRFLEYLTILPKVNFQMNQVFTSVGRTEHLTPIQDFLSAINTHKGLAALYYAWEAISQQKLTKLLNTIHQETVHVISNNLGHYFTCGESIIRLAKKSDLSTVKNHLLALTFNLMQAFPAPHISKTNSITSVSETLSSVIHRGSFVGYHYMIIANALIQNRSDFSIPLFQEGLSTLATMAENLPLSHPPSILDSISMNSSQSEITINALKHVILQGNGSKAKIMLHQYLQENQITNALLESIIHAFTRIAKHPHDPHFLTFPVAASQLVKHISSIDTEILLLHLIEYATNNIQHYGTL